MTLTTTTRTRIGAVAVALAPAVMFVALAGHPFLAKLPDSAGVANAVAQSTARWGIIHMLTAVGIGLIALAFLAIRARLRDVGEDRFSVWGLPFVIAGSALFGLLPAMEFAPLSAELTGGDVAAVQTELQPWFIAILATSSILFAIGAVGFARGVAASRILSPGLTRLVVPALIMLAVSRMVPLGVVQFYLQAVVGLVALWPLAYHMWRVPQPIQVRAGRAVVNAQ